VIQRSARGLSRAIALATLELKLYNFVQALERRYAPDQPRVPAGNPDGGQWTSGGNLGALPDALSGRKPTSVVRVAAKKPDIKFVDHLQKKYGFDDDMRERIHDEISGLGLSNKELEKRVREILGID